MIARPARIGRIWLRNRYNVQTLPGMTRLDLAPANVLAAAAEHGLTSVVVIGRTAAGEEYFAASQADGGDVLWALERCKKALLAVVDR